MGRNTGSSWTMMMNGVPKRNDWRTGDGKTGNGNNRRRYVRGGTEVELSLTVDDGWVNTTMAEMKD